MWNYCIPMGKFTDSKGYNYDLGFYISEFNTISAAIVFGNEPGKYISGSLKYDDQMEHYTELKRRIVVCFPELGERLITGDFLSLSLEDLFPFQVGLAGNLPYNISSQIFFRLLDYYNKIPFMVCMVQKEVAERIASPGGDKDYGILSVLLQAYYLVEYLFTVGEHVFFPPPKVKSAVIRLMRKETLPDCDFWKLKNIVKAAFNQRRKMLRNSLSGYPELLQKFPGIAELRPENLSVEDFIILAQAL